MSKRSAAVLALLLGLASCEGSEAVTEERGAGAAAESWIPGADECEGCHDRVAAGWADSRHHLAFSNVDFQRAYAREPKAFCRDCHAPGLAGSPAASPGELESPAGRRGIGCADCHLEQGRLLSGPARAGAEDPPHALVREPDFATQSCARCHEFDFPAASPRRGAMMQTTMGEHRASPHADRSCGDCHFPGGDHALASSRDDEALRAALQVAAHRESPGPALILELEPRGVGHALPTGDLFRRLALHARWLDEDGEVAAEAHRYLDRHFAPLRHADGRRNLAARLAPHDDRLTGPTTLRLEPRGEADLSQTAVIHWWIDYERVDERDNAAPERSTLADGVRLAEGRL